MRFRTCNFSESDSEFFFFRNRFRFFIFSEIGFEFVFRNRFQSFIFFYIRSAHAKTLVDLDETQSLTALELGEMYIGETETNQLCSIHFNQNGVNRAKLISFCLCDIQIAQFKRREGLRFGQIDQFFRSIPNFALKFGIDSEISLEKTKLYLTP